MKKEDVRTLPAAAKEEKRKQAVGLRKRGVTFCAIAELVGVHERTVIRWIRKYEQGGLKALKAEKVGRGVGRFLNADQEKRIKRLITDKCPDQLKLFYALWSPQAVRDVIKQERCIALLSIRTVGKYLSLWGFTPQRPLKKAYEQDPKRVKKCLDNTYPSIKTQAKAQNAPDLLG